MQVVGLLCVCRSERGRMGRMKRERAGICGVERERVDTALCGADPGASTLALSENIHFYRRVWRAKWLLYCVVQTLTHTLYVQTQRRSARCCAASARQRTLTHPASLSSPLSGTASPSNPHVQNPHRIPCTRSRICIHPCHSPQRPSPSTLSYHTRTSSGGAYVQSEVEQHTASSTSQHRLSPRVTLPIPHVNQ